MKCGSRALSSFIPVQAQHGDLGVHGVGCTIPDEPPGICQLSVPTLKVAEESLMVKRVFALTLVLMIVVTAVAWPRESSAAATRPEDVPATFPPYSVQFYDETGHAAVNSFQEFWRNTPNALFV